MAIEVDDGLLDHMRQSSGAIEFELRRAADAGTAQRGLSRGRADVLAIPHPDEPDGPFASFASDVEPGARGPGFSVDMADAEAYDGILEEALERVLLALDDSGLRDGCLTWPDSSCEQTTPWRRVAADARLDLSYASDDPPPQRRTTSPRPSAGGSSPSWSTCSPLRTPRSRLTLATGADGLIWAIGGASKSNATVRTIEIYDPQTDTWRRGPSLRIARRGPGAALGPDGRLYAIGGYGALRGGPATADTVVTVEACDLEARRWDEVASLEAPAYNEIGAATGSDGRIYALSSGSGGITSAPNCFQAYDTSTDTWTAVTPPQADYPPWGPTVLAGPDGRIYATGGIVDGSLLVDTYDPATGEWQRVTSPDHVRSGFGAAVGRDGCVHLVGGVPEGPDQAYDPSTDRWHEIESMTGGRFMIAATATNDGRILTVGGYSRNRLVRDVDAFVC
jgi:hypothetical protein